MSKRPSYDVQTGHLQTGAANIPYAALLSGKASAANTYVCAGRALIYTQAKL